MGVVFFMVVAAENLLYIDFACWAVGKNIKNPLPQMVFFFMVMNAMGSNLKEKKEKHIRKNKMHAYIDWYYLENTCFLKKLIPACRVAKSFENKKQQQHT